MYRYGNGQISLSDFQQPMGMHLQDDNKPDGDNSGTMIVDATCAPFDIRYPQDVSLLNLRKIQCAILRFLNWLPCFLLPCEKLIVIQ